MRRGIHAGVALLLTVAAWADVSTPPPAGAPAASDSVAAQLDLYEVTNRQLAAFLNEMGNPRVKGVPFVSVASAWAGVEERDGHYAPKPGREQHPATEVSFDGARAYCEWAGKRLPTEAEWQRTCEGTEGRVYPWGADVDSTGAAPANLEGTGDGFERTAPVGSYPDGRGPGGHWDLGGNVWEWTLGPEGQPMLRGGSWANGYTLARCAHRDDPSSSHSYYKGSSVGFRCAR
jgi:formylglycine-generating enzyme required for sulfatase activity